MDVLIYLYRTVDLFLAILDLSLIAYAIFSWFPFAYQTRFGYWLVRLVNPILKPFRKLPLQFLGLDWTVFLVLVLLHFVRSNLPLLFFSW